MCERACTGTASQSFKVDVNAQAPVSVCCRANSVLAACYNIRQYRAVSFCVELSNVILPPHEQRV